MENWRKFLTEEEKHDLEKMATMQGWSTEQTIARIVMSGNWKYAFEMLRAEKDTLKLDLLATELDTLYQEQEEILEKERKHREPKVGAWGRWRKKDIVNKVPSIVDPEKTREKIAASIVNFVTAGAHWNLTKASQKTPASQRTVLGYHRALHQSRSAAKEFNALPHPRAPYLLASMQAMIRWWEFRPRALPVYYDADYYKSYHPSSGKEELRRLRLNWPIDRPGVGGELTK